MSLRERCEQIIDDIMCNPLDTDGAHADRIEAFARSLGPVWTKEKPKETGHYWWRSAQNAPKHILIIGHDFSVKGITGEVDHIDEIVGGDWSNRPIEAPYEP